MKLSLVLLFLLVMMQPSVAQKSVSAAGSDLRPAPHPDPHATLAYIHAAWEALTRSTNSCASLEDIKVTTEPVMYLPAGLPEPQAVEAVWRECRVRVEHLPRKIDKLGDVRPEELPAEGLLYLPNPYVVPGGRFNEMYGWDSYFILLGLEADHREELAKGIVENFLFEIEHYGGVLNANRTYYLTRSQPPFLTSMIRAVMENPASFPQTDSGQAEKQARKRAWLERAYALAAKDYTTWLRPEHRAGETGLARYFDYGEGPVPEMADDASYYTDVIQWALAHRSGDDEDYLVKASEHPDAEEARRLKETSCDVTASVVCGKAWAQGYRLSKDFYRGDRAMRESGYDPSNRFGPFSGRTHHFAPVCLNSLLYRYERDMESFARELGKQQDAAEWGSRAAARNAAMHRWLWQAKEGTFTDYDFVRKQPSQYPYVTSLYPLWAGVATPEEAKRMRATLKLFERPGGLSMSATMSGLQWDEPYGWAPANWLVTAGLDSANLDAATFHADAVRIAERFTATVDAGFAEDGTIREKYNMAARNAHVRVLEGYKENVIGFGWTNGVYLKMRELLGERATQAAK
jgi:alpha,alpha-trehalase